MHDHWLIATALSVSAIGIIWLLLLLGIAPEETGLAAVRQAQDGTPVRVRATVQGIETYGNTTVLILEQPVTIEAVTFDPVDVTPGSCVSVIGQADSYSKEKQIRISRMERC